MNTEARFRRSAGGTTPSPAAPAEPAVSIGQYSGKGRKETNQDFHGALIPGQPTLDVKGIAVAIADGISSSPVSAVAAETAVKSFLTDYYCTSETWSVKTSARRVISAANSWLHAQTRRSAHAYDVDRGYVCTFSALILKAGTAHLFHIGDSRIHRLSGRSLEQLTTDHHVATSTGNTYLSRALGVQQHVEIDYRALPLRCGDIFILTTDGVHDFIDGPLICDAIAATPNDLDMAARHIAEEAYRRGSQDNLTVQIVQVDTVPEAEADHLLDGTMELPFPPQLEARMMIDGYRIVRPLHANSRSQVFLAEDMAAGEPAVIKVPSLDMRGDPAYLRRFVMEEWIARRLKNAHAVRSLAGSRRRTALYLVSEYVDGQTLTQWMIDNPQPCLATVRGIIEQIARGLQSFHRMEMVHQDIRPDNIMIDRTGTVKIIDFGSASVAGIAETRPGPGDEPPLGTLQYMAPEYLLGDTGTPACDIFSLGVITYQMLTGALPYGAAAARLQKRSQVKHLRYITALSPDRAIPPWIDRTLEKAVHPDPTKRYQELSEFIFDLSRPDRNPPGTSAKPFIEQNPLLFWKLLSLFLAGLVLILLARLFA